MPKMQQFPLMISSELTQGSFEFINRLLKAYFGWIFAAAFRDFPSPQYFVVAAENAFSLTAFQLAVCLVSLAFFVICIVILLLLLLLLLLLVIRVIKVMIMINIPWLNDNKQANIYKNMNWSTTNLKILPNLAGTLDGQSSHIQRNFWFNCSVKPGWIWYPAKKYFNCSIKPGWISKTSGLNIARSTKTLDLVKIQHPAVIERALSRIYGLLSGRNREIEKNLHIKSDGNLSDFIWRFFSISRFLPVADKSIGAKTSARRKYIYIYIGFTYRPAYWSSKRSTQGGRQRAWRVSSPKNSSYYSLNWVQSAKKCFLAAATQFKL